MRKIIIAIMSLCLALGFFSLANARVVYQTDFEDGGIDGWTPMGGIWTVEDGALQIDTRGNGAAEIMLNAVTLPQSFILEFDVKTVVDGGGASLTAFYTHWQDWSTAISHHCRTGRFGINETVNNSWVFDQWFSVGTDINPFLWQHSKVVMNDRQVRFEYAGRVIYDVTLPISLAGGYLLLAGATNGIHEFDNVIITTSETSPCSDDTLPPTGSVHAYPNLIWPPNNKPVKISIVGSVRDEMSIARDEGGAGVSSAHLLIDGTEIVPLSLDTDGRFNAELEVSATKGAIYVIELYATDTKPQETGGPNSGLVDSTYIIVPHDIIK